MMQEKPRLLQEQTGTQNSDFYILLWSLDIFFSRAGGSKEKSKHRKSDGSALTYTQIYLIYTSEPIVKDQLRLLSTKESRVDHPGDRLRV